MVEPGASPGTLSVAGAFAQGPGGRLRMELDSATVFDVLAVAGAASLGGMLELAGAYMPSAADRLRIVTAGTLGGSFATVTGTAASLTYAADGLTLCPAGACAGPTPSPTPTPTPNPCAAGACATPTPDPCAAGGSRHADAATRPGTDRDARPLSAAAPAPDGRGPRRAALGAALRDARARPPAASRRRDRRACDRDRLRQAPAALHGLGQFARPARALHGEGGRPAGGRPLLQRVAALPDVRAEQAF